MYLELNFITRYIIPRFNLLIILNTHWRRDEMNLAPTQTQLISSLPPSFITYKQISGYYTGFFILLRYLRVLINLL